MTSTNRRVKLVKALPLTLGQAHDLGGADTLLPGVEAGAVIADKAYDAQKMVIAPCRGPAGA